MAGQLAAYKALAGTATARAVAAFEPQFLNHMVVVLDACFMHRSRTLELKDGNPLNEVRMLCASILQRRGVLTADKTIKYNPERSIVKLRVGDEIALSTADFDRLSKAFFAEIDAKFVA
jgi:hypothetical protein